MTESPDLPNKPHNLPPQPTPFIGRQDEIADPAGMSDDVEAFDAVQLFVERARRVRRGFSLADSYVNFLDKDEGEARVQAAYGRSYERLVELKNKYDPNNFFSMNQNIKPTV